MNATLHAERGSFALVEIIQLKWLMTRAGKHVHVERMQSDAAYACETLDWAEASGDASLRQAAARLRAALTPLG